MGGGQRWTRPVRVYQTVTDQLAHRIFSSRRVQKPIWYNVIESIPPSETITRPFPPQHKQPNPKARKPSRLFQPQQLVYEEDDLRRQFYQDHPWELARPRVIVEMDGRDAERYDWSKGLQQPGMPLCGECVVQRQLWMMYNVEGITREQAYDIVRREFYDLRHAEDIERRIAKEEAMKVGAYFGKSSLQVGMELEDRAYEGWKKWAGRQIQGVRDEQDQAYTNYGATEETDPERLEGAEEELTNASTEAESSNETATETP